MRTKITYKEGSVGKVALTEHPPRSTCLWSITGGCLTPTLRKGTLGGQSCPRLPRSTLFNGLQALGSAHQPPSQRAGGRMEKWSGKKLLPTGYRRVTTWVVDVFELRALFLPPRLSSETSLGSSRNDAVSTGTGLNKAPRWASLLNYAWALCDFTPGPPSWWNEHNFTQGTTRESKAFQKYLNVDRRFLHPSE